MLNKFLDIYQKLNKSNLHLLGEIYAVDVVFTDPAHELRGLNELQVYFAKLYNNITSIRFDYSNTMQVDNKASVCWMMCFSHPKLAGGGDITVEGNTQLEFNSMGRVTRHRDYFDLGELLYEHIPLLGGGVRFLKRRLSK